MKICFTSIDIESDFAGGKSFEGVENLDKVLGILKKYNISATLFVTGRVLEKYGERVMDWSKDFEISCHSFSHRFWNKLSHQEKEEELDRFIEIYEENFGKRPQGFRAPSHIIDEKGLKILKEKGFLYDSSVLPHYPPFKKYRGYLGKAPLLPHWIDDNFLEIPVSGQILGIPLAGTWISKSPFFIYRFLFLISTPDFLTLSLHSWDSLNPKLLKKIEEILKILKGKNYQFLSGYQIYDASISKNRR